MPERPTMPQPERPTMPQPERTTMPQPETSLYPAVASPQTVPHTTPRSPKGLNAFDQQREASMADEGGTSGMVMESEDTGDVRRPPTSHRPYTVPAPSLATQAAPRRIPWGWITLGVGVGLLAAGVGVTVAFTRR